MQAVYVQMLQLRNAGRGSQKQYKDLSITSGVKSVTPLLFIPTPQSLPGSGLCLDVMHSVFHGSFKNVFIRTLELIGVDGRRLISSRMEGSVVPHDIIGGFQRIFRPNDVTKSHFHKLSAADERFLMTHIFPSVFWGVVPLDISWAFAAFGHAIKFLGFRKLSLSCLDKVQRVMLEVFSILDDAFPVSDMKLTIHILIVASERVASGQRCRGKHLDVCVRANESRVHSSSHCKSSPGSYNRAPVKI